MVVVRSSANAVARAAIPCAGAVASLVETDLLEDANSPAVAGRRALSGWNGEVATLDLRPFQIVTLRLARAQA